MNNVQLELEKILEYFEEKVSIYSTGGTHAYVAKEAYKDAKEKCERLLEVVTGIYPESRLEDTKE